MYRPNFTITKKLIIHPKGYYRFYSPFLNLEIKRALKKSQYPKAPTYTLDPFDNRYPNVSGIQTEKQLCLFLFKTFGEGEYRLTAHVKGRRGGWTFWKGEITNEGFSYEKKKRISTKVLNSLKEEFKETEDSHEKGEILKEIREEESINKKPKHYGFSPYLKPSCIRGEFVTWEEDIDIEEIQDE